MTGTGTEADPYVISDASDLQDMDLDLDAYYILGADIDASATVGWNGGLGFDPVGNYDAVDKTLAFNGWFDGKGHTISNLVIDRPLEDYVGLFGYTYDTGVGAVGPSTHYIKNVTLENCDITGGDSNIACLVGFGDSGRVIENCHITGTLEFDSTVAFPSLCAGFVGYHHGSISDSDFNGTIVNADAVGRRSRQNGGFIGLLGGGTITRCWSAGTITMTCVDGSRTWELGGFAGMNSGGAISRCFSTIDISITGDGVASVGGFIGWVSNLSPITDCYARGDVVVTIIGGATTFDSIEEVGGFAGANDNTLTNVYSTGLVSAIATATSDIGGLVGKNFDTVTASFWDTETSGQAASDGGTGKTTAQLKDIATITTAGWAISTIWYITPGCNNSYPCLLQVNTCCTIELAGIEERVVLEAFRNIEIVYGGRGFIDKSGNFRYESRYRRNV